MLSAAVEGEIFPAEKIKEQPELSDQEDTMAVSFHDSAQRNSVCVSSAPELGN